MISDFIDCFNVWEVGLRICWSGFDSGGCVSFFLLFLFFPLVKRINVFVLSLHVKVERYISGNQKNHSIPYKCDKQSRKLAILILPIRCTSCKLRVFLKTNKHTARSRSIWVFVCLLLLIQSLDLHLLGKFVNGLPDKTGETRKDVYFKTRQCQWTTAEVRSDFI